MNFFIPQSYDQLKPAQLRWLLTMPSRHPDLNSVEFKTLAFLRFAKIQVITKEPDTDDYLIKVSRSLFLVDAEQIYAASRSLDWILFPPKRPWRPERIAGRRPTDADFSDVDFRTFLAVDNLFQGYLQTQNPDILRQIAGMLLPRPHLRLRLWELIAIFNWVASVKDFFARKFSDFFSPVTPEGALGALNALPTRQQLEDSMNAQIRALTKGDITREEEILSLPCWRALTELNAQAREYRELEQRAKK